jgi:hemolysin activation/secretion protein
MQIMDILKDYQDQEAKAELEVGNTVKDLELARNRFQMAQRSNQIYEEAARERLERDRLRKIELEMASSRAQKAGEKTAPGTAGPDGVSYHGSWPPNAEDKGVNARATESDGKKFDINAVVVTGDRDAVYGLGNWQQYENDALYTPMSEADIESFRQRLLKDLQDQGYVFSTVSVYKHSLNLGFLKFRVHVGKKGDVTVVGNRWYTAKQILDSASWETGEKFNYRKLYANLFDFNTRPDVRVNTKLMPKVDEFGQRIVDVEMSIEDHFPIHGSLSLSNTGSGSTGDWRLRSTLQHLNLTKRNDILSLEWLTDQEELSQVNAFSGSYYLPLDKDRGLTLYAGYSESDINDIEPLIDVFGKGYYAGTHYSKILKTTDEFNMDTTFGWLYQFTENEVTFGNNTPADREVTLSMPSLSIGYSEKIFDSLNGRNYMSNTLLLNFAGKFGSSNSEEFRFHTPAAEGNFVMDRFQFARYQRLFTGENEPGKWSMFFRLDAQLADDALVPAVQKGIGGANSVRGYEEREISADSGVSGSLELHTPLVSNFFPGLIRTEEFLAANPEDWKMHRLQFIAFYDFGKTQQNEPLPGEEKSESMSSIGAGVRLGVTKYSQIRWDYGFPLDKTDVSDSGRSHLQLQLQF